MSAASTQIVRYQNGNVKVEIMARPGMVTKYREGKCSLQDALVDDRVYRNIAKGEVANAAELSGLGGSNDAILDTILKNGKYSQTAAEKREHMDKLKREVVNFLHSNFIDPRTRTPHPVTRIEGALAEAKINLDPESDAEHNARKILKKLQLIIRLEESTIDVTVVIPNNKIGQTIGICYSMGTVKGEEYGPENAYIQMVISPGQYDKLVEQTSSASQGLAVVQIAGAAAEPENAAPPEKTHPKKKSKRK